MSAQDCPGRGADDLHRSPGRPRDEGAEERILEAATALMLERGVPDVTVDDIAELANVGKATVYRRYPSKSALAESAIDALFRTSITIPNTGSLREDLTRVYADTIDFAASRRGNAFLRLAAVAGGRSRKAANVYWQAYERRRDEFGIILDRALARGEIGHNPDRAMFFDSLPALLMFKAITNQPMPSTDDVDVMVDGMIDVLQNCPTEPLDASA